MSNTFYWHDYETFGLRGDERRPSQFAGVRTDENLNLIGEGEVLYCRPNHDFLPSPESCLLTGILPQYCEENGLPENEIARAVIARLSEPGTIGIGYNNLSLDDEVSRFLFWRNFLPPYKREYSLGCGRWDLYPITLAVWALRPEGIEWPLRKDWIPKLEAKRILKDENPDLDGHTFKLECLTAANGISHEKAHDALSDVYGTVALAGLIRKTKPKLWQWAFEHRGKQAVIEELNRGPVVWVDSHIGQTHGYLKCVLKIAAMPHDPNRVLLWDLERDPEELFTLKSEDVERRIFTSGDENDPRLPVYTLRVNKCPFVCSHLGVLSGGQAEKFGIDLGAVKRNAEKFTPERMSEVTAMLIAGLEEAHEKEIPEPEQDPDEALYSSGFPTFSDSRMVEKVERLTGEALAESYHEGRIHFDNPVYDRLLLRYRARNFPETLTDDERTLWLIDAKQRIEGRKDSYVEALDQLAVRTGEQGRPILSALYDWSQGVFRNLGI